MPRFEILVPKSARLTQDFKMQVEAGSWVEALKLGRLKIGEAAYITENVFCDVKEDGSLHVTDAGNGQVFRIWEIVEGAQVPATISSASLPAGARIGRAIDFTSEATADLLEETFEFTQQVHDQGSRQEALYFMLDLAMGKVGTEAGSVLTADITKHDLRFEAARGPKAAEVMKFVLKMGQGLVGFCVAEAVGLAVSDVSRDKRFFAAISEKIGYPTRSILCVPMQVEGQVLGALELINKTGNDFFSERDLNVANFIAHQLGEYLVSH
jgi:hypothetical protein